MNNFIAGSVQTHDNNKNTQYNYFLPNLLNREYTFGAPKLLTTLEQATKTLGKLNSYGELIPDIDFFIMMHVFPSRLPLPK